jgi:Carbohydrate esterase, sialic acid-specific acetylesterase
MQTRKYAGDIEIGERHTYDGLQPIYGPLPDATGRLSAPLRLPGIENLVIVTIGQSNAANFAAGRYRAEREVINFGLYDGNCYRAVDPLIGASGDTGNFATRLGDILITRGFAERVVLAPIAMGNTRIEDWALGGVFHARILALIRRLFDAELSPHLILWQQGEGNQGDDDPGGRRYRSNLIGIVETFRSYGIAAPFMIALCTLCGAPHPNAANARAGQLGAVNVSLGTYCGPDTDQIGPEDRFDGCHMSETGVHKQALMWADAIAALRN